MLTDSHCHLGSHKFGPTELPQILSNAVENKVSRFITLATCLDDLETNLHIAQQHDSVFCCLGIHPCDVAETPDNYMDTLTPLASDKKCVAIGETGLDYFHPAPDGFTDSDYYARQRTLLDQHFQLASALNKNIVIHTRDRNGSTSLEDALTIYKKYADSVRAVFHCFISEELFAQEIIALGGLVSFTGIATFKNPGTVLEIARSLPAGSFMVETDAPYLAPVPFRGKRCEPAHVRHTAERIALARGENIEDFARHTNAATEGFFKFS